MKLALAALVLAAANPALAETDGTLTYEMFETAVAHVNLDECPAELAGEGRFCRVTMNNDSFHVFAFAETGEQALVGMKSWYMDDIALSFE